MIRFYPREVDRAYKPVRSDCLRDVQVFLGAASTRGICKYLTLQRPSSHCAVFIRCGRRFAILEIVPDELHPHADPPLCSKKERRLRIAIF